jgi:hypothetical protein
MESISRKVEQNLKYYRRFAIRKVGKSKNGGTGSGRWERYPPLAA